METPFDISKEREGESEISIRNDGMGFLSTILVQVLRKYTIVGNLIILIVNWIVACLSQRFSWVN